MSPPQSVSSVVTSSISSATPSSTALSSTASSSASSHHAVTIAVAVVVVMLAVVAVVTAVVIRMRTRRRRNMESDDWMQSESRVSTIMDANHIASKITPFGAPGGEMPRFAHGRTPGSNMRIAHRSIDGSWRFLEPAEPLTPSSVRDVDSVPTTPISPVTAFSHRSKPNEKPKKKTEHLGYFNREQYELMPPPPAYSPGPCTAGDYAPSN